MTDTKSTAPDHAPLERRLAADGRRQWNQSYYFNAYDPESRIGCIIRAGFMEGLGKANSWTVFFIDGKLMFHRFNADLPCPDERLADGVRLGDMELLSLDPLKAARIALDTGDFAFDLTWRELHPLVDAVSLDRSDTASFIDTFAHAHLEGTSRVSGSVTLPGGERRAFSGTGARDIAAGIRDWGRMEHYRVAWPIFEDGTSIVAVHGFSGGHSSFMSMANFGDGWKRIADNTEDYDFADDGMTVKETRWSVTSADGQNIAFTGTPLFRCFLPADSYVLAEHIARFVRDDGVIGYGLVECGFKLPWNRIE
jgi:hypothetical protein